MVSNVREIQRHALPKNLYKKTISWALWDIPENLLKNNLTSTLNNINLHESVCSQKHAQISEHKKV